MPAGQESQARAFYSGVLGLTEETKPANLAKRGGLWFVGGTVRLHLGVDPDFVLRGKRIPPCSSQDWPTLPTGAEPPGIVRPRTNLSRGSIAFMWLTPLATGSSYLNLPEPSSSLGPLAF